MLHDIVAAFLAEHCIGDWQAYLDSDAAKPEILDRVISDNIFARHASLTIAAMSLFEAPKHELHLLQPCFADAVVIAATEICIF